MKGTRARLTMRDVDALPDTANVRVYIVALLFAVHSTTIWRWVKNGSFPAPRKLSAKTTVWSVGELRKHLASCPRSVEAPR